MPHPEDLIDPLMGGTDGKPLFDALAERAPAPPTDARLTAMAHYLGLLTGWQPPSPAAPTLALQTATGEDPRTPGHETRTVPGYHFTVIEAQAGPTAQEIAAWLQPY